MRIIDCEQGGKEWLDLHVGRPTASQFHRIMTPAKMEWSRSTEHYRNELLAEEFTGHPLNDFVTDFINRGQVLEEDARSFYELSRDVTVRRVGFVLRDDGRTGCSPDGLTDPAGLEIKTPAAAKHVGYMLEGFGGDHRCQIQGCLWLCEKDHWDVLSYNPELAPVLVRHDRDEEFIKKLAMNVDRFIEYLDISRDILITKGYIKSKVALVA